MDFELIISIAWFVVVLAIGGAMIVTGILWLVMVLDTIVRAIHRAITR